MAIIYNSKNYMLSIYDKYNEDIFMNYIIYLYESKQINILQEFYKNTNMFYNNLTTLLMEYNNSLCFDNKTNINFILKKFDTLTNNYYTTFKSNLETYNKIQFDNYFQNKKKNINDLDPVHNNGFIISKLHQEWLLRITNIKNYYYELFLKPMENTETNTITSYINKTIEYIYNNIKSTSLFEDMPNIKNN